MPRPDPSKRTPLWLQRLRAKDLLQVVGKFPDFPIVVETFRECLDSRPGAASPARAARRDRPGGDSGRHPPGRDRLAVRLRADLPVHAELSLRVGRAAAGRPAPRADRPLTRTCLTPCCKAPAAGRLLDPQAVGRVEGRLRRRRLAPRTAEEMAETLRDSATWRPPSCSARWSALLEELEAQRVGPSRSSCPAPPEPNALDPGRGARPLSPGLRPSRRHEPDAAALEIDRQALPAHSCA